MLAGDQSSNLEEHSLLHCRDVCKQGVPLCISWKRLETRNCNASHKDVKGSPALSQHDAIVQCCTALEAAWHTTMKAPETTGKDKPVDISVSSRCDRGPHIGAHTLTANCSTTCVSSAVVLLCQYPDRPSGKPQIRTKCLGCLAPAFLDA